MEGEDFVLLRPILQNMVNFCLSTHIVQRLGRGLKVSLFVNVEENYLFELNGFWWLNIAGHYDYYGV